MAENSKCRKLLYTTIIAETVSAINFYTQEPSFEWIYYIYIYIYKKLYAASENILLTEPIIAINFDRTK